MESIVNIAIWLTKAMVAICVLAALAGAVKSMLGDMKNSMKSLAGVGALLVLFGICFAISSGDVPAYAPQFGVSSSSMFKMIGGGIVLCMLMTAGAFILMIADMVKSTFLGK